MAATDWVEWHAPYDDPASPLARRLVLVQGHIRRCLDDADGGAINVVSMCSGEGRDLLGVLADHPRRQDVSARLVEINVELASRARRAAAGLGLTGVEVVEGDAAATSLYVGAVPAQLVLVCGVFGNISDADVEHTVSVLPELCAPGATLIWTRHRRPPDLTDSIRRWFDGAGFSEIAFEAPNAAATTSITSRGAWLGVGVHRYEGPALPLDPSRHLFTFIN